MSSVSSPAPSRLQVSQIGYWVLGLIAFTELLAVGVALGVGQQQTGAPSIVERVEYITLPVGTAPRGSAPQMLSPTPEELTGVVAAELAPPRYPSLSAPVPRTVPLQTPPIADPIVERLVLEAQEARVADDMRSAIVKLEDAAQIAPEEPNVLYQFAQVFEAMGVYDKAEDYYQKVFELGALGAGNLYELAAYKMSHGFLLAEQMQGKLALGRVRQFFDKRVQVGERVILTVPVLAAPNQQINPDLIEVSVSFYDKLQNEVVPASKRNMPETKWVTGSIDWLDGAGEELLQVTYYIPEGTRQELHLFGQRTYFGHLVELSYQGELVDSQAWPRTLARKVNARDQDPLFLPEEFLPPDMNRDYPLLPPLPRH